MADITPDDAPTTALLCRLAAGERVVLEELLALHRPRMRGFIDRRMEPLLRSRIDPSDIVQDAHLEIARRIDDFLERRPMPFRLWVIKTTHEHLLRQRRKHLEADCRDAGREQGLPQDSTRMLAGFLADKAASPSFAMQQAELLEKIKQAMAALPTTDQEILMLRIFEGLDNQEVARVLELEPDTASKRYGRALIKLRQSVGPIQ
jgi:RNA polymerase sigma-70 factor (ECF subfamily)